MKTIIIVLDEHGKYESTEAVEHPGSRLVRPRRCPVCKHEEKAIYYYTRLLPKESELPIVWLAERVP